MSATVKHSRRPVSQSREGEQIPSVTIHVGDVYISASPVKIKTILGSCISACLYDPGTAIGGMNHFLLPGDGADAELSTRYGVNAMEVLINEMMQRGASRSRLQAKIFGGADIFRIHHSMMMIGQKNIRFIRSFLDTEHIPVLSEHLGGNRGLIIHFLTGTFEVFLKSVATDRFKQTEEEEAAYSRKVAANLAAMNSRNVTLF